MTARRTRTGRTGLRRAARALHVVTACLATAALAGLAIAHASTYVALTVTEMVDAADVAIFGEVQAVTSFERDGYPWTRVTFAVERDLIAEAGADPTPGDAPGAGEDGLETTEVELAFLGGSLPGGPSLAVAGMPGFERGERILLLAYDEDGIASPIVGFRQGLWRVTGDTLVDEAGRVLAVDGGTLALGGTPTPVETVLDAFVERFGEVP